VRFIEDDFTLNNDNLKSSKIDSRANYVIEPEVLLPCSKKIGTTKNKEILDDEGPEIEVVLPPPSPTLDMNHNSPIHKPITQACKGIIKPNLKYALTIASTYHILDIAHEAIKHQVWRDAMNEEMKALKFIETWILTKCPLGANVIGNKWVFRVKEKANGFVEKYKAKLVALGYV
jgi:hypothetical protein